MTTPQEPPAGDPWQNAPRMAPESQQPPPPPGYGAPPPGYGGQPGYGGPPGYGGQPGYGKAAKNGMGIAALILGILGVLGSFIVVGAVLGILAIVFGFIGRGKAKRGEATNGGMALTGIILGFASVIVAILMVAVFSQFADEFTNYADCIEQAQTRADQDECRADFEGQFERPSGA